MWKETCDDNKTLNYSKNLLSEKGSSMLEIKDCVDYEVAKRLIREYSEIKGAESCFVSLDKELADLDTYYKNGALFYWI